MRGFSEQQIIAIDRGLTGKLRDLQHRSLLIASILLAVIGLSLTGGYVIGADRKFIALAIFGPLVALPTLFFINRRFDYAVLMLPIVALAIPFEISTGTESKIPAVLLVTMLLCGIWMASMAIRNAWRLAPSPINRPMLFFCAACVLSLIWGIAWRDPVLRMNLFRNFTIVQIATLVTHIASIGAALLIGNFIRNERHLKYLLGCFLFFGSVMTIFQILKVNHGSILADRGLWGLWTVIPAYALLISHSGLDWRWRVLLLVIVVANLYQTMLVNVQWKSGWIPTVVAIFVATSIRSWRWFIVMSIVTAALVYAQRDFFHQMIEAELNEGADGRIGMWEINLRVVGEHWLFGTGPGGYAPYYMTYYPNDARSTHNNYLDIIAQFGVVGSIIWLWFAVVSTREGFRLYRKAPPGFLKTMALITVSGWIGAQASMLLGDWILPFPYNQTITGYRYTVYSWIFVGTLISLRQIIERQRATETVGNDR
ncbi:MAG: O-antigen ligase family protein [Roseiflexus sp.]|nr:O-antigen ligase family protein [Roseiflexus sp.]MCS7291115.1 O-antigen ligase family protein [Roseiflexus sp.]MDW8145861.1 O-antigen ligase family protein [Roseiflexaceae bacterium]